MVTKKQCEDLIDRLADKSLTFGCLVLLGEDRREHRVLNQWNNDMGYEYITVWSDRLGEDVHQIGKRGEELGYKTEILGHPILLGRVLQLYRERFKWCSECNGVGGSVCRSLGYPECDTCGGDGHAYPDISVGGFYFSGSNFKDCRGFLIELWDACDFKTSLQQIYKDIEWEDEVIPCPDGKRGCLTLHTQGIAKPSPATDLFTFLIGLGL